MRHTRSLRPTLTLAALLVGAAAQAQRPGDVLVPTPEPGGDAQVFQGNLDATDATTPDGRSADRYQFQWPQYLPVHLEARGHGVDTTLSVMTPSGVRITNDDAAATVTDARLDFQTADAGTHTVVVTSGRPGAQGRYELVVRAPGTLPGRPLVSRREAAPARAPSAIGGGPPSLASEGAPSSVFSPGRRVVQGDLAAGDARLDSGELYDTVRVQVAAGDTLRVRVRSAAFDPYLIVRTPSGRQLDNDDHASGRSEAGIDVLAQEPGEYTVLVTSDRLGETGRYTLSIDAAPGTPTP